MVTWSKQSRREATDEPQTKLDQRLSYYQTGKRVQLCECMCVCVCIYTYMTLKNIHNILFLLHDFGKLFHQKMTACGFFFNFQPRQLIASIASTRLRYGRLPQPRSWRWGHALTLLCPPLSLQEHLHFVTEICQEEVFILDHEGPVVSQGSSTGMPDLVVEPASE